MTNHPNRSKIFSLRPIRPSTALEAAIISELTREAAGAVDRKAFEAHLRETQYVAMLGLNGQRFHISAMRVMLDDDLRLKPQFAAEVIADAVQQAIRKQYPNRKHVRVDVGWANGSEDDGYFEYQASVWWNYRRQYEQQAFYIYY